MNDGTHPDDHADEPAATDDTPPRRNRVGATPGAAC